ncbi:transcriptional regulator family: Fungal Specific TF [Paecilomyces variotii]|nr:transcriptional regulator family: Fungal Specific TF [Paecilomyces variotii]
MVGVPRSKACGLCRERRVKCDEIRPGCTQCARYGAPCPGYSRDLKFQDEGPGVRRRLQSSSRNPSSIRSKSSSRTRRGESSRSATQSIQEHAMALLRRHVADTSIDERVDSSLVRKSFINSQPQLFSDFVCAAFPTLYFHNRFRSGTDPSFPDYITQNFGTHTYQDASVCSLSSIYLAHLTKDPALLRASRQMYSLALKEVCKALDTEEAFSDNMLSSVMILSVYEMYAQTSRDAWARHSEGVKRLMLSRGVKGSESGFGRSCYYAFRGFLIATALFEDKPCFLDEEEWQEFAAKVRAEDSQKPGEWSAFVDISEPIFMELTKCPRYLSEARTLSTSTSSSPEAAIALVERVTETRNKLLVSVEELRTCIAAHSQRAQGISYRPGNFVGPVPEVFADTSPSLLLRGATSAVAALDQLLASIRIDIATGRRAPSHRIYDITSPAASDETGSQTYSQASSPQSPSSGDGAPRVMTLPFRIVSEISRGPSGTSDQSDPRAVIWLDRIASSMGMLGIQIVQEPEDDPSDKGKKPVRPIIEESES